MAGNSKKTANAKGSGTKITRITATGSKKTEKLVKKAAPKSKTANATAAVPSKKRSVSRPFVASGNYFKGAWYELKQVRWPTRRATWGLTGAIIVFTAFIAVIILLLDALFKYLFELMLG